MTQIELEQKAICAHNLGAGSVAITGMWIWASFESMPVKETRQAMAAEGFRWIPKRQSWAFMGKPCTSKKHMPWSYIVDKYGLRMLEDSEVTA